MSASAWEYRKYPAFLAPFLVWMYPAIEDGDRLEVANEAVDLRLGQGRLPVCSFL
jgi:hypothetical protein